MNTTVLKIILNVLTFLIIQLVSIVYVYLRYYKVRIETSTDKRGVFLLLFFHTNAIIGTGIFFASLSNIFFLNSLPIVPNIIGNIILYTVVNIISLVAYGIGRKISAHLVSKTKNIDDVPPERRGIAFDIYTLLISYFITVFVAMVIPAIIAAGGAILIVIISMTGQ